MREVGIEGVSRSETMEALRHKRGSVTDRYVTLDMEQRRQHIEQLAGLLTGDEHLQGSRPEALRDGIAQPFDREVGT